LGHRAPARLGLKTCCLLLYLPPGAFKERRIGHALREGSASGRCRHRRADIGAGDRRCEAPRSAGGSWRSSDARWIEEAEKTALHSSPRSQTVRGRGGLQPWLGGGYGYGRWNLERHHHIYPLQPDKRHRLKTILTSRISSLLSHTFHQHIFSHLSTGLSEAGCSGPRH
jgi:hypothetical protein